MTVFSIVDIASLYDEGSLRRAAANPMIAVERLLEGAHP